VDNFSHSAEKRSQQDSTDLDVFLTEQVYPALFGHLDSAFPEFAWTMRGGHWTATVWPPDFPYLVNDQHPDRLMVYPDRPWWIKIHGHSGMRFLDYVNGGRKPDGPDFLSAVRHLCEKAGVAFPDRPLSEEGWRKFQQREARRAALEGLIAYAQQRLWSPAGDTVRAFLHERGFTDQDLQEFGFGFYVSATEAQQFFQHEGLDLQVAREAGLFWHRLEGYILIPWADAHGHPLTIYGRWHAKKPPEGKPQKLLINSLC
jgi:putative DNA primase/helicase